MAVGYLLLLLLPIAAVAYLVWDHRRKAAVRGAAAAGRLEELLAVAQPLAGSKPTSPADIAASAATAPAAAAQTAAAPAAPIYVLRDRVLDPPRTLLYYLLKTGLPDHVVLAHMTLGAVLEAGPALSGFAREEQIRRLSTLTVDFVVTDKSMRPVAVVELAPREEGTAAQADRASARTRLAAAGLRYLELDPDQLPRRDAIRTLVLGTDVHATA